MLSLRPGRGAKRIEVMIPSTSRSKVLDGFDRKYVEEIPIVQTLHVYGIYLYIGVVNFGSMGWHTVSSVQSH